MGTHKPNSYRVKRNGEWVWVHPPEQEYVGDKIKPVELKKKNKKKWR